MSYLSFKHSYYFIRPHKFIYETYLEVKWFIQRGRRGWSDSDVWGFDSYLSRVIYEGIGKLRKSPVLGCPAGFLQEELEEGRGVPLCDTKQLTSEEPDERFDKWNEMLGKIASGFEAWDRRDDWFETGEWEEYQKLPTNKEKAEMAVRKDKEAYNSLQESLELFKKYFVNLWD